MKLHNPLGRSNASAGICWAALACNCLLLGSPLPAQTPAASSISDHSVADNSNTIDAPTSASSAVATDEQWLIPTSLQLEQDARPVSDAVLNSAEQSHLAPENIVIEESDFGEPVIVETIDADGIVVESQPIHITHTESAIVLPAGGDPDEILFGDWVGYNATQSSTTWLPGSGDDFGMLSLESFPTLKLGRLTELNTGISFHFLDGPIRTDLPPRLFDFKLAYQSRETRNDRFVLDYRVSIGAYSDFEGSARKGVRFPGHVVGYYALRPWILSVLGAEFLDRDDISVLPVVGLVLRPKHHVVIQAVFPKPQVQIKVSRDRFIYFAGELGGGSWAVERTSELDDVVTYSDLRVTFGIAKLDEDSANSIEVGYAFDRSIQYRSGLGNYRPDNALIVRFRTLY
ncbi:MAG TPA: hypothetical protein DDW52_02435 [Planctomycetaceae bacterium]|nr:hypothetical protein [Planctomycetaceae bacterium]